MSLLDNVAPAPRKVMTLFYVVDTSGSMYGSKIGSVNSAMEEAITSDLPEISAANDDAEIKVAIMQFSSGCSWITPQSGPIAIGDDADKAVLAEFTGTIESVITVNDKHTLKALIRKVSVRASEFQSHSKQSGDTTSSAEDDSAKIAQDAVNEIKQDASQNSPVSGGDSGAIDVSLDQDWGNW